MADQRKLKTRKQLQDAMAILLADYSFDDITTSQLSQTAHISRSGFYTHYKDKYDMIDSYQQSLFNKLEYVFERNGLDIQATLLEVFEFLDRESLFAALITQNGSKEIQNFIRYHLQKMIANNFYEQENFQNHNDLEKLYNSVYLSHAMFGVYQTWVTRGKKETPKQMTDILLKLLPDLE